MSKFNPIKTTHDLLNTIAVKEGQLIFTSDRGEGFVDYNNGLRISIGSVIIVPTELDRAMIATPLEYKLYYTEDSLKLYSYISGTWKCLNPEGLSKFTQLTDVPQSYKGYGGMMIKVKADESGLEFVSPNTVISKVNLVAGTTVKAGQLLCLTATGYKLADRTSLTTINDIVLAASANVGTTCTVIEFGYFAATNLTAGGLIYLSTAGGMTQTKPGSYVKVIGYAINSKTIKFKPDSYYK